MRYGNAEAHVGVFLVGLHFELEFLRIQFLELGVESGDVVLSADQLLLDRQGLLFGHESLGQQLFFGAICWLVNSAWSCSSLLSRSALSLCRTTASICIFPTF